MNDISFLRIIFLSLIFSYIFYFLFVGNKTNHVLIEMLENERNNIINLFKNNNSVFETNFKIKNKKSFNVINPFFLLIFFILIILVIIFCINSYINGNYENKKIISDFENFSKENEMSLSKMEIQKMFIFLFFKNVNIKQHEKECKDFFEKFISDKITKKESLLFSEIRIPFYGDHILEFLAILIQAIIIYDDSPKYGKKKMEKALLDEVGDGINFIFFVENLFIREIFKIIHSINNKNAIKNIIKFEIKEDFFYFNKFVFEKNIFGESSFNVKDDLRNNFERKNGFKKILYNIFLKQYRGNFQESVSKFEENFEKKSELFGKYTEIFSKYIKEFFLIFEYLMKKYSIETVDFSEVMNEDDIFT